MNTKTRRGPDPAQKKNVTGPRAAALCSLLALERDGRYANLEIDARLRTADMNAADRALYTRLVYGVTERRITLDWILAGLSSRPPEGLDPDVRGALRMGIYQLLYMDRIPEHAAVDESVRLVPKAKAGYVNAVLRSFLRAGKAWRLPEDEELAASVRHSVPVPLLRLLKRSLSADESAAGREAELDELLCAMNREPKTALRINTVKTDLSAAAQRTGGHSSPIAPDVLLVDSLGEEERAGLAEGLWFVEDEASRIAAASVGARPGELVVDTCACPGGKSFSMALDMKNEGELFSFDLHANKLSLIESGAERLGIGIIRSAARDAREPDPALVGRADRVLCDAPCSGLGVIAKKPDIRYKDLASAEKLPEVQKAVLEGASRYAKPGGTLVYSTCTLNPAENGDVVRAFLEEHQDFTLAPDTFLPEGMRTFWPHRDGCDGFFAARMTRSDKD